MPDIKSMGKGFFEAIKRRIASVGSGEEEGSPAGPQLDKEKTKSFIKGFKGD